MRVSPRGTFRYDSQAMKGEPLVTERLLLRYFTLDDVEALYQLVTIPAVIRYAGNTPAASREAARETLKSKVLRDYKVHGYGRFAVVWKATGAVIGFCGVKYLDEISEIELGYRYLPEFWGQGLAKESCRAVIENAREAVPTGGHVSIVVRGEQDRLLLLVEDDGPGIPADVLPEIFDAFVTTRLDANGTGLGLTVSDAIVRQHGGSITASNCPKGGARLEVKLPHA